ncbi:MAG TPA: CrcB family protein [Pirellulales bacterium]
MLETLSRIGFVAIGSACGGVLRWGIGNLAGSLVGAAFPYGTFFINITGSLFLGWFMTRLNAWSAASEWFTRDHLRLLFAVGLAGGYTTFSSFEWEGFGLFRDNETVLGTIYLIGSVVIGLIAIRLGVALGKT